MCLNVLYVLEATDVAFIDHLAFQTEKMEDRKC